MDKNEVLVTRAIKETDVSQLEELCSLKVDRPYMDSDWHYRYIYQGPIADFTPNQIRPLLDHAQQGKNTYLETGDYIIIVFQPNYTINEVIIQFYTK